MKLGNHALAAPADDAVAVLHLRATINWTSAPGNHVFSWISFAAVAPGSVVNAWNTCEGRLRHRSDTSGSNNCRSWQEHTTFTAGEVVHGQPATWVPSSGQQSWQTLAVLSGMVHRHGLGRGHSKPPIDS